MLEVDVLALQPSQLASTEACGGNQQPQRSEAILGDVVDEAAEIGGRPDSRLPAQGELLVQTIEHVTKSGKTRIECTPEAGARWRDLEEEINNGTLFPQARSWYMGDNIPGKKRQMLMYTGGLTNYLNEWHKSIQNDYAGFRIS